MNVCIIKGVKRLDNGALVKDFGVFADSVDYPSQAVVWQVKHEDPRFMEKAAPLIHEEFELGSHGYYLGEGPLYGAVVTIKGYSASGKSLNIAVEHSAIAEDHQFASSIVRQFGNDGQYFTPWAVAKMIGCSNYTVSRITSSMLLSMDGTMEGNKMNVGLGIKFDARELKVSGYTRKNEQGWQYSHKAVELIQDYKRSFPQMFAFIDQHKNDVYSAAEIFGE